MTKAGFKDHLWSFKTVCELKAADLESGPVDDYARGYANTAYSILFSLSADLDALLSGDYFPAHDFLHRRQRLLYDCADHAPGSPQAQIHAENFFAETIRAMQMDYNNPNRIPYRLTKESHEAGFAKLMRTISGKTGASFRSDYDAAAISTIKDYDAYNRGCDDAERDYVLQHVPELARTYHDLVDVRLSPHHLAIPNQKAPEQPKYVL